MKTTLQSLVFLLFFNQIIFAQDGKAISGDIQSTSNQPIEGATIVIKSLNKYDISDANGHFNIDGLTAGVYKLVVSYLGYNTEVVTVEIDDKSITHIPVTYLQEADNELEEVVISGSVLS